MKPITQYWTKQAVAIVCATLLAGCGNSGSGSTARAQAATAAAALPGAPAAVAALPLPLPQALPAGSGGDAGNPAPPDAVPPPVDEAPPLASTLPALPVTVTPAPALAGGCVYPAAVQADFAARDKLPQFVPQNAYGSWGPWPAHYAAPAIPANCEALEWQRERVLAVAKKYIGLGYRHHHVPGYDNGDGMGLDCSNFTAWVYNYGLGIGINSGIATQAETAGRRLASDEALRAGDLLFIKSADGAAISHVLMYVGQRQIIDSTGPGVQLRAFSGWYVARFSHARRLIE